MGILRITVFVSSVALSATGAWAQFGLYGSPEVLDFSQARPAVAGHGGYWGPSDYPVQEARRARATYARQQPSPLIQAAAAGWQPGVPAAPAPPVPPEPPALQAGSAADDAAPAQAPNLVDQMLCGLCGCEPADDEACGCYSPAVNSFAEAACGGGCCPWYGSVSALVMSRNQPNRVWTSYDETDLSNQLCNTQDIGLQWKWGGEVRFGRRFGCGGWALEATYWTLEPFTGQVDCTSTHPEGVGSCLDVGYLEFGGDNANDWFMGAAAHRLTRRNEFHNVEVNLVRNPLLYGADRTWDIDWTLGVRYFRFEERLVFGSLKAGASWGVPSEEAYLDDHITNSLVGFQFGFDANYMIHPGWRLFVSPKFGIYNNHIRNNFNAYLGDGTIATQEPEAPPYYPYSDYTYPVRGSKDVLSFLTQIDLGLDWQFTRRWSARIGYRVLVATGIGLADNQFPHFINDMPELAAVDYNGELILHGAFAGLTYNF